MNNELQYNTTLTIYTAILSNPAIIKNLDDLTYESGDENLNEVYHNMKNKYMNIAIKLAKDFHGKL